VGEVGLIGGFGTAACCRDDVGFFAAVFIVGNRTDGVPVRFIRITQIEVK
jgi:hypothetical protein